MVAALVMAVLVLAVTQIVMAMRLQRVNRRVKRRRLVVGPEEHIRLQKQLYDHIARTDLALAGDTPSAPLEFRSEWGEDTLLYDLFRGQRAGAFVEVGALDGLKASVSSVFERLGWAGVLIEATPAQAAACARNRPGSITIHAALGPRGSSGTTAFLVPRNPDHQPSAHRPHEGMGTAHLRALEKAGADLEPAEVPFMTMDDALARAGIERLDWAVIDVEGAELSVLRGFDLARFRPRVLVVEDNSLGRDGAVTELLDAAGYVEAMWIGPNRVYIAGGEGELLARARRLAETVYSPLVRPEGLADTDVRVDLAGR